MSDELKELFVKFIYHLALEKGLDKYGDGLEAENLYRQVANEISQLFFNQNENETLVRSTVNKLEELAPKFGFVTEKVSVVKFNKV